MLRNGTRGDKKQSLTHDCVMSMHARHTRHFSVILATLSMVISHITHSIATHASAINIDSFYYLLLHFSQTSSPSIPFFFFFLMIRRPPRSPLFPSPPLSR